jgi:hypothetical protein
MEQKTKINWSNPEERRAYNRRYRLEHPKSRKEYGKRYRQKNREHIRLYANQWAKANPEKVLEWHREWREKNRHKYKEEKRLYRVRHREEDKARDQAKYFVIHWYCCMGCGAEDKPLEEHHPDYSKPLETFSLCKDCHKAIHRELKRKEKEGKTP